MREINNQYHQPLKEVMLRFFLQLLPVVAMVFFILQIESLQIAFLQNKTIQLTLTLGLGMFFSLIVYQTRIRFLPSFLMLIFLGWLSILLVKNWGGDDLDPILKAHSLQLYLYAFYAGWIIAFGLIRWRIFPIVLAVILLGLSIVGVVNLIFLLEKEPFYNYLWLLVPQLILSVHIIFNAEQLRDYQKFGRKSAVKMFINSLVFSSIALIVFFFTYNNFKTAIQRQIQIITQGKFDSKNSMLDSRENGSSVGTQMSPSKSISSSKNLLLTVFIDNFFENTKIPNPLYLTTFYYAYYDTATETFEVVNDMPDKDLFRPDVSKIPLYQSLTDSSVLDFGQGNKGMKVVEIEVYNKGLSPSEFVAPTTAFSVQPIAVDIAFQKEYKSAFVAKSMVSNLNSAYFVYNTKNEAAQKFQEERYKILRNVPDFTAMDSTAYAYYTAFPNTESLKQIGFLAQELTAGIEKPIDKIIAIKEYFLSKDANGKPLFKYTENPGIPDIPSTKTLNYFLFDSHKGYCAHYAGATLFMLRALGIPSRIAAGFLTEDRSSTNPGWYFLYADQVHAWVQVYFPGYGWLDFDTTVGNDDVRESEQPDATPPLQPDKATLSFSGYVTAIDSNTKTISINSNAATLGDQNLKSQEGVAVQLDISAARIVKDTNNLAFNNLKLNDTITAISFEKDWLQFMGRANDLEALKKAIASPIPMDLIHLRPEWNIEKNDPSLTHLKPENSWSIWLMLGTGLMVIILLIFSIPFLIRRYYFWQSRSENLRKSAYYTYLYLHYCLWMMNMKKLSSETSMQYASKVDKSMNIACTKFTNLYLQLKYSNDTLPSEDEVWLKNYASKIKAQLRNHFHNKVRRKKWLNVMEALRFVISNKNVGS